MRVGEAIGPYVLDARLGDGGMAEVWAATHARWGHSLAIKLSRASLAGAAPARRAFEDEVRAVAALDHPNVVRIYDQGVISGDLRGLSADMPWLAMERASGTLRPTDSWEALRTALLEVLDGLAAAHAIGILHLDVKPSNVLRREDGSHALADFGIAALRGAMGGDPAAVSWGSPAYMAPERFDGRPERLTEATDLYAVGCMAFHLATRATPFACPTWDRAALAHRTAPVPDLAPRLPVAAGFGAWVRILLAKRPGDRFATAREAAVALAELGGAAAELGGAGPLTVEPTLTATLAGEPVPVADLVVADPRALSARIPEAWPVRVRPRRLESVGLGLLGLLAVPFVGREEARRLLWAELVGVAGGAGPRLVAIRGPRGAGRTRLGDELAAEAAACASAFVLRIPAGSDPLPRALRLAVGVGESLPAARVREAAALRLGLDPRDPVIDDVVGGLSGGDALAALVRISAAIAERRPVVVWVDDALRDDALVEAASRLRCGPRVLVVVTSEAPFPTASLEIAVSPLDTAVARQLLADWVGLGPELVADVAERCEGDVGLALEMVREGVRTGRLAQGTTGLEAMDPGPLALPEASVSSWVALLPAVSPALERAAVLGRVVDRDRLSRALGDPDAARRVEELVVARGLGAATSTGFTWASPATRAAILANAAERLSGHHLACAAACADSERWARGGHLLAAGRLEEALPDLFAASHDVIAAGRMAEAARLLARTEEAMRRASLPEANPAWGRLWRCYADLGPTHQGWEACRRFNERAAEQARRFPHDPAWRSVRSHAVGGLAWLANVQLLPNVAKRWIDEEASLIGDKPAPGHLDHVGWYALTIDDPELAVRAFSEAVALATAAGLRHRRYVCDSALGVALCRAGAAHGIAHLEAAGKAMLEAGYLSARADLASALGDARRAVGEPERALAHYEEALRAMAEGEARADLGFRVGYALVLRDLGRLDRAVGELDTCRRLLADEGPSWAALIELHRAAVAGKRGDEDAFERLEAAAAALVETGYVDPDVRASAAFAAGEAARRGIAAPSALALATRSAPRSTRPADRDPRA